MRHKMLTNYFLVEPCNSPSQKEILFNSSSMCLYTFFFLFWSLFYRSWKNEFGSFKLFFVPLPVVRDVHSVSMYFFWGWLILLKAKVKRQQNKRQAIGAWGDSMGHCLVSVTLNSNMTENLLNAVSFFSPSVHPNAWQDKYYQQQTFLPEPHPPLRSAPVAYREDQKVAVGGGTGTAPVHYLQPSAAQPLWDGLDASGNIRSSSVGLFRWLQGH